METVSATSTEKTRKDAAKIQAEVLRRLASVTQTKAADRMGVSVSTVSRMASDDRFGDFCALLAAIDLKVVSRDALAVEQSELSACWQTTCLKG